MKTMQNKSSVLQQWYHFFSPLKHSGISLLHFKVFNAIQV